MGNFFSIQDTGKECVTHDLIGWRIFFEGKAVAGANSASGIKNSDNRRIRKIRRL